MTDWGTILQGLTLALVASVGAFMKKSAEDGAKAAIRDLEFPREFRRELQKIRGKERQELRVKSYGALWKELRPLAIYDTTPLDKEAVGVLCSKLTDWYFSDCGGLFLTPEARDFYFTLQDLLQMASRFDTDWRADRIESGEISEKIFRELLISKSANHAIEVLDYFSKGDYEQWREKGSLQGKTWREEMKKIAEEWRPLDEHQRFAVLQQLGSKLRTSLSNDLESRMG
jgi:hypothetical protein